MEQLSQDVPNKIKPSREEKTNNTLNSMRANTITARYFEARILPLSIGLISKSLIVPQLNSEATIPAAIMIANSPAN